MEKNTNRLSNQTIGILGGMGPQATEFLYRLMINKSATKYGAKNNDDYPDILIASVPVPDFISDTERIEDARQMLVDRVKRMMRYEVRVIGIACNTAHVLRDDLIVESQVPIISIIQEIKQMVKVGKYKKVGLLATPTTCRLGLYGSIAELSRFIYPEKETQERLAEVIRGVLANKDREELRQYLLSIMKTFQSKHMCDAVILGCTELPLIAPQSFPVPVLSTLEVLSDTLLDFYYGKRKSYYENI